MNTHKLSSKSMLALVLFLTETNVLVFPGCSQARHTDYNLKLNALDYFETRGLNILLFSNWYNKNFSDSKISGIEIIHHEVRTATNGDVRLNPTPQQCNIGVDL